MEAFLDYILSQMDADTFAKLLRKTNLPYEEQDRLANIAWRREREQCALHAMYPNEW